MTKYLFVLGFCIVLTPLFAQDFFNVSGIIKDAKTGDFLIGATVFVTQQKSGTVTNEYGFYSLRVPRGKVQLQYSFVGYSAQNKEMNIEKDIEINIELNEGKELQEVTVTAESYREQVQTTQMSVARITAKEAKLIPALLGESDILKALQLKPGVQSGGEGTSGLSVRGGQTDQNLFLLDEAVVYNPLHLFGFFSAFNSDAVKDVKLYKGDFPAQYGGRLSSVVDVRMSEGNRKELTASGGLGLISSRLTLEGPIQKDKSSFIVAGRRTYVDVFTRALNKANEGKEGYNPIPDYFFYDLNAGASFDLGKKDKIYFSGYYGQDRFGFNNNSFRANFNWGNTTGSARWNHLFNSKLFVNTALTFSDYQYEVKNNFDVFSFSLGSGVRDYTAKTDFSYFPNNKHVLRFGASATYHQFKIGRFNFNSTDSLINFQAGSDYDASQFGLYINDEYEVNEKLKFNFGLRGSAFQNDGKWFGAPEPRFAMRYALNDNVSLKGGYSFMMQYQHLVSNSGASLPTDIWYPSDKTVRPQQMHQVAGGITWNLNDKYLITNELFYKWGNNQVDFRDGARLFINPDLAEEFVFGRSWGYGNEFYIEKKAGKLKGWIGYTLMWSWRQFDDINSGRAFPSRFDRRHDLTFVGIYELSKHWTFSTTWVFSTGNAITLPVGRAFVQDIDLQRFTIAPIFTGRNSFRFPNYHRWDLNLIYKWKHKEREQDLTLSFYNAYNRRNPYFIYFEQINDSSGNPTNFQAKQVSLFPVIPALTWNFKF